MLGTLPNDFLRMPRTQAQTQEEADHATALHLQHQMMAQPQQAVGRLQVRLGGSRSVSLVLQWVWRALDMHHLRLHKLKIAQCQEVVFFPSYYSDSLK